MTFVYSQCRIKAPRGLPLALEEAKHYLKIDFAEDDELLTKMIAAATAKFESYTSRALIEQTWQVTYRQLGRICVTLPIKPTIKLIGIELVAFNGSSSQFNLDNTELDTQMSELYFHTFPYGYFVKVKYVAGYGDKPEAVPDDIKTALLNHVGYMYENRSIIGDYSLNAYDEFKAVRL